MVSRNWTLVVAFVSLASGSVTSLTAQDDVSRGRAAIRYLERGVRSDGSTRTIASGPAQIGIDVNSSVEILVNTDSLRSLTASLLPDAQRAEVSLLSARMDSLGLLIDSISAVTAAFRGVGGEAVRQCAEIRRATGRGGWRGESCLESSGGSHQKSATGRGGV